MNMFQEDGTGVSVLSASVIDVTDGTTLDGTDTVSFTVKDEYSTPPYLTLHVTFAWPVVAFGRALHHEIGIAYSMVLVAEVAVLA